MNAVISIILLAVALGAIVLLLTRRENTRRPRRPERVPHRPAAGRVLRPARPPQRDRRVRLRVPPRERRRLPAPPHAPSAHPAAAGYPLHPPPRPRPSDHRDPHLHPGILRLQRAAFPAGNAGHLYDAEAPGPPHKIILSENAFHFRSFLLYYLLHPAFSPGASAGQ